MGFDGSYLTSLQLLPSWNNYFDTPSGTRLGLFTASTYFPLVAFAPFQGTICDIIGRRLTIAVGSLILICGAVVGACATSDGMFIAGRVIVGLGNGFGLLYVFALSPIPSSRLARGSAQDSGAPCGRLSELHHFLVDQGRTVGAFSLIDSALVHTAAPIFF